MVFCAFLRTRRRIGIQTNCCCYSVQNQTDAQELMQDRLSSSQVKLTVRYPSSDRKCGRFQEKAKTPAHALYGSGWSEK